jgi:hypothetical protein
MAFLVSVKLGGPPRWARALVYIFAWLPAIVLVVYFAPRFVPIFQKLDEKGELPQLTSPLMAFVRLDTAYFHLPTAFVVIALLAVDEWAVRLLRRRARGSLWSWLWVAAASLAGIVAQFVIVSGLVLPVFKMGSAVR